MNEYERLTKKGGFTKDLDMTKEWGYSYIYNRLAELEDKLESGQLVDILHPFIKEAAEARLKELEGGKE